MSVGSIAASSNAYLSALQPQSNTSSAQQISREPENDGDKDDGVTAVKAPAPSVNLNGQSVGNTINVTA